MNEEVQSIEMQKEPGSFHLIATLGVAGFVSGLVLVSIYLITKPVIAHNKAEALKAAIFEVLPNTVAFQTLEEDGQGLKVVTDGATVSGEVIYEGFDEEGNSTGFAVPGGETGYQDVISAIFGYEPAGQSIIGFKVLASKETPGLGDKIYKDADFQSNFDALSVEGGVEVVKKGEKKSDNQVEAITGATISSNAIGRLINNSLDRWKSPIDHYFNSTENLRSDHE